jgi:cytochrome oxidase Cu insertion factor (SCO1/SenC/PrrC family)
MANSMVYKIIVLYFVNQRIKKVKIDIVWVLVLYAIKKEETLPFSLLLINLGISNVIIFIKLNFSLIDQDGQTFTEKNIEGRRLRCRFLFQHVA